MENEQTLKNTRISFLHEIFQKTLKNAEIRILYPKNTTSIPIILLWKCPSPLPPSPPPGVFKEGLDCFLGHVQNLLSSSGVP